MITIIDKYIFKKFISTFVYAITLILLISIIFDISENIEDFIDKKAPISKIAFEYYLNFIPYFGNMFSPLFVFIAVIFFTSKMASNTEIIAILNSTVSFKRLLVPYMAAALCICIGSLLLGNFVIPKANKIRLNFEEIYIRNQFHFDAVNVHRKVDKDKYMYFESYNANDKVGYKFSLEQYDGNMLIAKTNADYLRWDTIKKIWRMENYCTRVIDPKTMKESIYCDHQKEIYMPITPDDFGKRINSIETMNYFELNKFIEQEKSKGNDNTIFFEVEKYKRQATPFATFILTLIGVSVASRKVRGGIGLHIGLGLLISFSYILFQQITTTFATYGSLNVVLACWLPNIIYLVLSLILIRLAPK